ncbi:MAG: FAD-dependent monooxygenase [Pseudomonadota bacterium]|nr:FAD-dependent monooxygenase [Pseudomonadota bacterium]
MRPAGCGKLESLYFGYSEFASAAVSEVDGERPIHPVAIVGAGPIGLTAALTLAKHGIRSVVLVSKNTFNDALRTALADLDIEQQPLQTRTR